MAERRMFAKSITESDAFLEMPLTTQALYLHLNMNADDDGFVSSPKRIIRMINANEDDLKVLLSKRFVLGFDNGIIVIKHWKMNNYIRSDRYKTTVYQEELKSLQIKDNGSYTELPTNGIPDVNHMVYQMETQDRIGKDRIGKDRIGKMKIDNIVVVYENEIGHITPTTAEILTSYLDELTEEMIIKAIKIASVKNQKNLAYIKGILNNWINRGYKTLSDIQDKPKEKDSLEARVMEALNG